MKKILITLFALISCQHSFAIDIDDVDAGDIYYVNGGYFNDDRRVTIIRVNKNKGKVKVKTSNGDTEWVYPEKLLTKNENENTSSMHPIEILTGIMSFAEESARKERSKNVDGKAGHRITFKNNKL